MRLADRSKSPDQTRAFANLRLLSLLFVFFIFVVSGTTVLIIATQTKENIVSITRDEMQSKAAIAALSIDGDALETLRPGDESSPGYLVLRDQLRAIRDADDSILYIYTMRKAGTGVEFVVDGDSGYLPSAAKIGQEYPSASGAMLAGFAGPAADLDFGTDQWGSTLSGYAPVRDSRGRIAGIIGLDIDATTVVDRISYLNLVFFLVGILSILAAVVGVVVIERRRSIDENLMVANRNYLTRIFESVPAGILIVDATTRVILDANPAALSMTGAPLEDVCGQSCRRFLSAADGGGKPVANPGRTADPSERVLVTADGRRIPVIGSAMQVVLDGTPSILVTFVDISDRKKAEEDLVAAIRKLKVLSTVTRNDIISDIYALSGYLALLTEDVPEVAANPISEKIAWVMERISRKSAFFRDYDDAGTGEPVWQNIKNVVGIAADRLGTASLPVRVACTGFEVFADPLLYKVFSSLFDNTTRHGMHATGVQVDCRKQDRDLVVSFEDDGCGIPEKDKERIFERGVGASTGLGLFLAREILGNTGLAIRETGEYGNGARFEIVVPEGKYRSAAPRDPPPGGT